MATSIISAIALDLGTTSIKAGLLDSDGVLGSIIAQPAPELSINDGRYESDALAYAETAERVLSNCLDQTRGSPPLGLCSQRSSFLIWECASGRPLTPLISWQDNRGTASCEALQNSGKLIRDFTGLHLTPYYFAPKLRVVLQEHPEWRGPLERRELLVGTLDSFLIWRWTNGKHHVTDASMAARTLLMDIRRHQWSPVLCELFGIPGSMLPRIKPSSGLNLPLNQGLTLQASLGDQSAALLASVGDSRSTVLVNLGTGGFVVRYLAEDVAPEGYLHTLIYQGGDLKTHIAIEGTLNSLAAALAPYPIGECRIEDLAANDILCITEPGGLGAPYFHSDPCIHFSEPIEHLAPHQIACLLLEGIVFRVARILEDFDCASTIEHIYLTGGLSELISLQQGIAQCAPCAVYRLPQKDSSLQGAALLASGILPTSHREAEKIKIIRNDQALTEKYRLWKQWFDGVLNPV